MPWRRLIPWSYLAAIIWLNAYVVRHVFALTFTGKMNSMHGFWMALAHLSAADWWTNAWLPQWAGGVPATLAYAPLVPWLSGKIGLFPLFGLIYILGPAALFLLCWQVTAKPAWALAAALLYSLTAPTELLLPDGLFSWQHAIDARRLYLTFIWDEAPHQLALAMVCLAAAAWSRGWTFLAAGFIAAAALANPFGVTGAMIFGLCWLLAFGFGALPIILKSGLCAYLLVCPFYPPSLLGVLQANAVLSPESAMNGRSWIGFLVVAAGLAVIAFIRRADPWMRFALGLAWIATALPFLYYRLGIVLLAQPGRYKTEMELALLLLAVLVAERFVRRFPKPVLALLAVVALAAACPLVLQHRRFSKSAIVQADPTATIEYQAGQWIQNNLQGQTIYTAGSLASWINTFADVKQYSGGNYTTAPNVTQQRISLAIPTETRLENVTHWLTAAGVDAILVSGARSPEFWKPWPREVVVYDGRLPLLWRERDTSLYAIPRVRRTEVHAIPAAAVFDQALYLRALEEPGAPELEIRYNEITGQPRPGDVVLVHRNFHAGWHATQNQIACPMKADSLGQIVVTPCGQGPIELRYDGGLENRICRWIAGLTLLAMALYRRL